MQNITSKISQLTFSDIARAASIGLAGYMCFKHLRPKNQKQQLPIELPKEPSVPIYKICFTGGPCGGKTSALKAVKAHFQNKGYRVFTCPQVPTLTSEGGGIVNPLQMTPQNIVQFQAQLIKLQIYLQDYFIKLAQITHKPAIILLDRGVMDPCAYVSETELSKILEIQGWNFPDLRDKRYDMIMFFVTAADGALSFYTNANNQARSEDSTRACALDQKTLDVWSGHNNVEVLDNPSGQTFQHKVKRCIEAIEHLIGDAHSVWKRTALIVKDDVLQNMPQDLNLCKMDIQEIYLRSEHSESVEEKLVKRGQHGCYTYALRRSIRLGDGKNTKNERFPLTQQEYDNLLMKKEARCQLAFKRTIFFYKKQRFELDEHPTNKNLKILHYIQREGAEKRELPPFITVVQDVSASPQYTPEKLAGLYHPKKS